MDISNPTSRKHPGPGEGPGQHKTCVVARLTCPMLPWTAFTDTHAIKGVDDVVVPQGMKGHLAAFAHVGL
jgi:hypothetical protein